MNRETVKTFILVVLVALSFLLSYILWSYQPKYETFYDANYISEADIGGKERSKAELIRPSHIVFHPSETEVIGFTRSSDEYIFFKEISTWSLTDFSIVDVQADENLLDGVTSYIELVFPSKLSAQMLDSIFSVSDEDIELPSWTFDRVYIVAQDSGELTVQIYSANNQEKVQATIEKAGALKTLKRYNPNNPHLQSYVAVPFGANPIYIPEKIEAATKKTLVANTIEPELFINALFNNPALVKPNQEESFFTDGQRGMRIFQDGRNLEFIHPIETNIEKLEPDMLVEKSIDHINGHKGWNNEYYLESVRVTKGEITYRLHYDGVPVFDSNHLTVIEQVWREQVLYQYRRSLISIGHLLNKTEVNLPNSIELITTLEESAGYDLDRIEDIQLGYELNYVDESHSLILEPAWFMYYENNWIRIPFKTDGNE